MFWKLFLAERRFELRYTVLGVGLGGLFSGTGLLADMQVRRILDLDASVSTTFLSTSMHTLALGASVVLGRVFYTFGKGRRRMEDRVRMALATEVRARERASRDPVTGLFNRSHLLQCLEEGLATREWSRCGALLFLLDLDDFKTINDTHGHHVGDIVLVTVARRIAAACADEDMAVRLGGDEFVVVHLPEEGRASDPDAFAQRLLAAVAEEIVVGDTRILPNTSIGIARVGTDGATCSDVLNAADLALYQAKLEPFGAFRSFDPAMRTEKDRMHRLESELRAGIERGELFLQYQPIYGTESGAIRSFEALVRWRHPEHGLIPPLDFIPLAESTGLILKLGRQILMDACRAASEWPKPIGVSVNLSPVQFNDACLVEHVEQALRESGLAPGRLDLEITESLLLEATPRVVAVIHRLKALGVRITMDDFGTGYSSLSTLKNFPFDRLKIDRSFTRDLAVDASGAEIVRTIVRLSKTMRMETILEGVETQDQLTFAQSEGLTEVQGYFYSRPLSQADAAALFQARNRDPLSEVA